MVCINFITDQDMEIVPPCTGPLKSAEISIHELIEVSLSISGGGQFLISAEEHPLQLLQYSLMLLFMPGHQADCLNSLVMEYLVTYPSYTAARTFVKV